jgi:hypothetical protein
VQRGLTPPFELHVTGADDEILIHCQCEDDARLLNLVPIPEATKLNARWPITATLTDATGETFPLEITPSLQSNSDPCAIMLQACETVSLAARKQGWGVGREN